MNYFTHGRPFLADPYRVAGTAVPDWLNVVNRAAKARSRRAQLLVEHANPRWAAVARGIVQHHHDDHWFHQTPAFAELSLQFTVELRSLLPEPGFRPSFLGHILVELMLDAALIEQAPEQLDAYYAALEAVDADEVSRAVHEVATQSAGLLAIFIHRFCGERFLYDYLDDRKLLRRLNHVMRRVKLEPLPESLSTYLPSVRERVRTRQQELLREPDVAADKATSLLSQGHHR